MITRPLELSDRLRKAPSPLDALYFVNVAMIVLFFGYFGSRFILAPGFGVDFQLPTMQAAVAGARPIDVMVAVKSAQMAFVAGVKVDMAGLLVALRQMGKEKPGQRLLVQADASLPAAYLSSIYETAAASGFASVQFAAENRAIPGKVTVPH